MPARILTAFVLLSLAAMLWCGCTEEGEPDIIINPPADESSAQFKNVQAALQPPSQVQFTFRITDAENHAVIIEPAQLDSSFRIFENDEEIDYSETSYFVSTAASLQLDMVVLLDFTNSMVTWEQEGISAVDLMVDWTRELIDQLALGHRMAIMEYHDRNVDAALISPFSADQQSLNDALDEFLNQDIDHGSSRSWDALYSAVQLFEGDVDDNRQRLVIFITDGKETSSEINPSEIISVAQEWCAGIFAIGVGDVANEATLQAVAEQTEGSYYQAADIATFTEKLEEIKRDLGGQYRLSYISLRSFGSYNVRVEFEYLQYHSSFEQELDLGSVYGDDRVGVITFDNPVVVNQHLKLVVRAQHVPRNISRFRFKLDVGKPYAISLPEAAAGGLCGGWELSGADINGWHEVSSPEPLPFGAFGVLWQIDIANIVEEDIYFEYTLDTTIYSGGKTFDYPHYIVIGDPLFKVFDFEEGDIPPLFANQSAVPWVIDSSNPYSGNYAITCGDFTAAGASNISLRLDVGFADTLSFYVAIDNQSGSGDAGVFEFYVDNQLTLTHQGKVAWIRVIQAVTPGTHSFAWRFVVAEADLSVNPQVWVDDIVFK
ncbi:MAG: VWA domain-containing protein [candidate division Zixibacteria bacterium]|nr:VWA domain-containing protein [candidate division Zixibacteria bacterium]